MKYFKIQPTTIQKVKVDGNEYGTAKFFAGQTNICDVTCRYLLDRYNIPTIKIGSTHLYEVKAGLTAIQIHFNSEEYVEAYVEKNKKELLKKVVAENLAFQWNGESYNA
ncbi:MAG TPA: hypothetical protein PLG47_06480 [Candidatus Dojkabacteria bacterium]|nr:hypothetical protein [Candidatus Dojkabacteria bacterium]